MSDHELHELLTHLTSVLLGLQILRERTPLSPRQRELAEHALRSARALEAVVLRQAARSLPENGEWIGETVEWRAAAGYSERRLSRH